MGVVTDGQQALPTAIDALRPASATRLQVSLDVLRVRQAKDAVDAIQGGHLRVDEKGLACECAASASRGKSSKKLDVSHRCVRHRRGLSWRVFAHVRQQRVFCRREHARRHRQQSVLT